MIDLVHITNTPYTIYVDQAATFSMHWKQSLKTMRWDIKTFNFGETPYIKSINQDATLSMCEKYSLKTMRDIWGDPLFHMSRPSYHLVDAWGAKFWKT